MKFFCIVIFLCNLNLCIAQRDRIFEQQIADTLTLFLPGKVSDGFSNRDMAISPDGTELYYTIQHNNGALSFIMYMKKENNQWSDPEVASFSGKYNDLEPAFSQDGKTLFFSSNRALTSKVDSVKDYDIWCVTKQLGKWGEPVNLGNVVNTGKDEFYPSVSKNNTLYFTRDMGKSKEDIVFARSINSRYDSVQSLPNEINTDGFEFNAFISPDEDYIVFSGYNRPDGFGSADLYISRKDKNGKWLHAKNMGSKINSAFLDYCPFITFDRKYFFLTSKRNNIKSPMKSVINFKQLKNILANPGNGADDVYWIKWEVLGL